MAKFLWIIGVLFAIIGHTIGGCIAPPKPPCGCTAPTKPPCGCTAPTKPPCGDPTTKPPCGCKVKTCPANEEYIFAKYFDPTCDDPKRRTCDPVYECRCKPGFVRHEGKCITKCECPNKCSDPFEEYIYTSKAEETCGECSPAPCQPVKECRCIPGFVRHEGKCIRKSDCPPKCTGANEVYINAYYEDETCDGTKEISCESGFACRCKTGFVRHNGVCIRKCDCPARCPENEELILATYGEETCDGRKPDPCKPVEECRCVKGYVRHNGVCIRKCDCPSPCSGANEIFTYATYGEKTCDGFDPDPCSPVRECRCREGYVRHEGKCIKECDCPPKCKDPFEEYLFAKYEDATCDNPKQESCKPVNACRCIPGYVRHEGKCIKKCDCPPECSDPNEVYILTHYEDITCNGEHPVSCTPAKACRCRRGYVRHEGKCIKLCECPAKCKDPFEEYVLANYGEPTCDLPSPDPCTPVKECRCIQGYVRHEGKCIKPCSCPPKCKDPNEIYILTKYTDKTCDDWETFLPEEILACRCRGGYVRHEGVCIKECDCPQKCNDPFEEYITTSNGEVTCDGAKPDPCKSVTECRCIEGYVRHEGKCIKPCQCPPKCTGEFEIFIRTTRGELTCDGETAPPATEIEACRCRRGYVRHEGKCIRKCDCPPKCSSDLEEYIETDTAERTCSNCNPGPCALVKACRCIYPYVRHEGKCIKECDCPPKCTGRNEVFTRTRQTEPTCDEPIVDTCSYVEECRCIKGYVRHNGQCIKPCDCPPKCKGPNEEYVWTYRGEKTCGDPTPAPCFGVKACRCIDGYVRHNGVCIRQSECPCEENEFYSDCAPLVQETCSTIGQACTKGCRPGCMCLPGFVRDCSNKCIRKCLCKED